MLYCIAVGSTIGPTGDFADVEIFRRLGYTLGFLQHYHIMARRPWRGKRGTNTCGAVLHPRDTIEKKRHYSHYRYNEILILIFEHETFQEKVLYSTARRIHDPGVNLWKITFSEAPLHRHKCGNLFMSPTSPQIEAAIEEADHTAGS